MKYIQEENTMKFLTRGLLAACVPLLCAVASPVRADPSSFQRSCTNIAANGDVLSADCRRIDGSWDRTAIRISGIENIDGELQYSGGASTFQRSCGDIAASGDTLYATCRRIDGSWNRTSIAIQDIANIDGRLEEQ